MTTPRDPGWRNPLVFLIVGLVRFYQRFISPALPRSCKYHPTCSQYAIDAVKEYGVCKGSVLAGWRLLRCNPFSHGGYDPVERQKLFRKKRAGVRSGWTPKWVGATGSSGSVMGMMRSSSRGVTMVLLAAVIIMLAGLPVVTGACSLFGGEETTTTVPAAAGTPGAGTGAETGAVGEAGEATTSSIETTTTTVEKKKDSLGFMAAPLKPLQALFFKVLKFLHQSVGVSWAWAIVILTVIVRIVLIPLTWRQIKSMRAMQALQPQMKALQEKYKHDREMMNQKLMEFYKEHKVSPFGSCLPLLLQLPVFFGLFYLLRTAGMAGLDPASSGEWAGIFAQGSADYPVGWLWIGDITQFDYILMFLFIASQFLASWQMARKAGGQQRMIAYMMPIVVGIFMFIGKWPSGLFIYWVTSNVWTIAQQFIAEKVSPVPVVEPEPQGKKRPKKGGQRGAPPAKTTGAKSTQAATGKKAAAGSKPGTKAAPKAGAKRPATKTAAAGAAKAPVKKPGTTTAGKTAAKKTGEQRATAEGQRPGSSAKAASAKAASAKAGQGKTPQGTKPKPSGKRPGTAPQTKATTGKPASGAGTSKKRTAQRDAGGATRPKPAGKTGGKTSDQKPREQDKTTGGQGKRADSGAGRPEGSG